MDKNYSDSQLENWIYKTTHEFYELVYRDSWLRDVFRVVDQAFITSQQTDFMLGLLGGPKRFSGRNAKDAHPHIFVDEEMWQYREDLLLKAMEKTGLPQDLRERWLRIDEAFKRSIVMNDPSECKGRFATDELIIVPNPNIKKAS
jgi:truncated hemoglobin YjbI